MAAVRRTLRVTGFVQGVGFRPFVYRLATRHLLGGWVLNDLRGVTLCLEGPSGAADAFQDDLYAQLPGLARIDSCDVVAEEPLREWSGVFAIRQSRADGGSGGLVTPDTFVCPDCVAELTDPRDRRHRYPLINCTNCGPRYSIIKGLPYDRPLTTMADFVMCPACQKEYDSAADRRFHAQPNACWSCGPRVRLLSADGTDTGDAEPARTAARMLREGRILAVKALGGYQLMADPYHPVAVRELRSRKERSAKPFALLAADSATVARHAHLDAEETRLLESPARPIVLLRARPDGGLSPDVAPGSATLGFMLPTTPLQHLLLADTSGVLIATSGNAPDEPMARTEEEALAALRGMADAFLVHDRTVHTRVDDSIARVVRHADGPAPVLLRRARGYVPDPLPTPFAIPPVLAVGAELKNTACLGAGSALHVGQHIGDLKSPGNQRFFADTVSHLRGLFDVTPRYVAHDLHPDFHSTRYARSCTDMEPVAVQHHHAHMASCMADNGLNRPVLGVIFDGTGYGTDGTIWGGEFLVGDYRGFERAGHLARFRLPGGDKAVREPARVAISLLTQHFGQEAKSLPLPLLEHRDPFEIDVLMKMTERGVNAPLTSSMGRLFDGYSALLGVCEEVGYEGQAAIELEQLIAWDHTPATPWPLRLNDEDGRLVVDHGPWLESLLTGLAERRGSTELSRAFHESIVYAVVEVCLRLSRTHGVPDVVLSGGVFLNQHLLTRAEQELTAAGLRVHTHRRIPPNDGGICVGQAMVAAARAVARDATN
ncbi:carbamoyltransferase HypF [Streptomyces kronopolitis]|uniref:carbamoyltransferase HypF n=1 Tax=Streptomyces kronopolitis TaxID=1612435 RepID=UPI00202B7164|nr:carbamoyltransferase HypF [Streptomyces kronopolitis]MCL6300755.1 carbamoyltransferase HypF [Streptomyces kronopolitis]